MSDTEAEAQRTREKGGGRKRKRKTKREKRRERERKRKIVRCIYEGRERRPQDLQTQTLPKPARGHQRQKIRPRL